MTLRGGSVLEVVERMPLGHLPARFQGPMRDYLGRGELTCRELQMLLEDDVGAACNGAPLGGMLDLWLALKWIRDELPAACWGNRDQVQLWIVYVRRARGRALLASFEEGRHGEDAAAEAAP